MLYDQHEYRKKDESGCTVHFMEVNMIYFVGIDIAKYKHDCFIATETTIVTKTPLTFENTKEGFSILLDLLSSLDQQNEIRIGFEATGHYGNNLKQFLEKCHYSFMELNPLLVQRFKTTTSLRRTKTDKSDAITIACYLSTVDYKPYPIKFYHIYSLKSLTRLRDSFVKERSKHLVRLTNVLDYIFPELKPFFNDKFSATLFYLLKHFPSSQHMSQMNQEDYLQMSKCLRHTISYAKFVKLVELANNTIGNVNELKLFELNICLSSYQSVETQIERLENEIITIAEEYHFKTATITGIGLISAATIVAEFGDFSRFTSANCCLAYAGLDPAISESGTMSFKGKMVKHGSGHLRYVLMNCAEASLMHNLKFYDYYLRKRREGKSHRVALSHVARKLVNIIFTLETKQIDYDYSLVK